MRVKMLGFVGTILGWSPVFGIPSAHPDHAAPLATTNVCSVRWDDDWSISRVPLDALTILDDNGAAK